MYCSEGLEGARLRAWSPLGLHTHEQVALPGAVPGNLDGGINGRKSRAGRLVNI